MSDNYYLFLSLSESLGWQKKQGYLSSYHDDIQLFRVNESQCQHPLLYQPGLFVMFSGRKVGRVNTYELEFTPDLNLLITTPHPIECETIASEENPVTGLYINLRPDFIFKYIELIRSSGGQPKEDIDNYPVGFAVTPSTERLNDCLSRLLVALKSQLETEMLAENILEEIYFLILQSKQSQVLINYALQDGTYYRITKTINFIQNNLKQKITVDDLANIAGMSVTAFHRAFKKSITDSPLQYIKKLRLNTAKSLIVNQGLSPSESAYEVGYESVPQFSREFKRYFGLPPSKAQNLGYRLFV